MKALNAISLILVIIGALNWGCIGLFGLDLVASLFGGATSMLSRIIYTLVGLAGIWAFSFFSKIDEEERSRQTA